MKHFLGYFIDSLGLHYVGSAKERHGSPEREGNTNINLILQMRRHNFCTIVKLLQKQERPEVDHGRSQLSSRFCKTKTRNSAIVAFPFASCFVMMIFPDDNNDCVMMGLFLTGNQALNR